MASNKDTRDAVRACVAAGLVHDPRHRHPRVVHPVTGKYVTYAATPGCRHAHKNLLKDVKKYLGVDVEKFLNT